MKDFDKSVDTKAEKKGPDFLSRLHGFLDVKGPNPVSGDAGPEADPAHLIRRAIMMRIAVERFQSQILDKDGIAAISPAVVRAFLLVKKFRHGARSLEALITQSRKSSSLEVSDLRRSCPAAARG